MAEAYLHTYQTAVDQALSALVDQNIAQRIWDHDHTVWRDNPEEITNRLGWLDIADAMHNLYGSDSVDVVAGETARAWSTVGTISGLVDAVRAAGYTHALLLGMGGSSLAPEVFRKTFGVAEGYLELDVLDSTDPGAVLNYDRQLDPAKTLYIVSTKSGGTVETLSFFKYFYNRTASVVGKEAAGSHFVAITDPGSSLEKLAQRYAFRATFLNDPNIGGRYSALSYFGLVPAALIGVDVPLLLQRAIMMEKACQQNNADNPSLWLGAVMGVLARDGRDKVTFITTPAIASFGDWVEQLIAESTGKEGKGILPVVGEPSTVGYGSDRLFVSLHVEDDDSQRSRVDQIATQHPVIRLALSDGV